jgi:hypothetical protein
MSHEPVSEAVRRLFEDARKRKGAPVKRTGFWPTSPSRRHNGRRVADTFAGRFRFVRFMESVQLEFGICFTNQEGDGRLAREFAQLVAAKAAELSGTRLAA